MEPCRLIFFEEEHESDGPNTPRDQQDQAGSQYTENQRVEEPKVDMIFGSQADIIEYYTKYAKQEGFGVSKRTSTTRDYGEVKYFIIACSRHHKPISKSSKIDQPKPVGGTICKAKINVKQIVDGRYQLSNVILEHNHAVSSSKSRHIACHKKLSSWSKKRIEMMDKAGIRPAKNYKTMLVEGGGYENLTFGEKECRNHINKVRNELLVEGDAEPFHKYLVQQQEKNNGVFYAMDLDEEGRLRNVFWADARSRVAYESFGDVITFDTTYLTNKYKMPFASFVGVNYHGQSILFGCGLISNEDIDTFVWLFDSWLRCMSRRAPNAIITDQDRAMQAAIAIVFPRAKHRFCLWHILFKLPHKLGSYSQYDNFKGPLLNCIYDSLSCQEFEEMWHNIIQRYGLTDNTWLSKLYERHQWVPAYVRCTFWAGMSATQRSESMNAFFDGYVNATTSLKKFVGDYDNALARMVENEKIADFGSFQRKIPCITVHAIEKQFQELYTNVKFKEVQIELRGTMNYLSSLKKMKAQYRRMKLLTT